VENLLTVSTPAVSRSLTTIAAVQGHLGLPTADPATVADLIRRVSAAVDVFLRRTVARETVQEIYRLAEPEPHLWLERAPVATITSVTADGVALAADEWEADLDAGLLYRVDGDDRITWQDRRVVVIYTGGWILPGATGSNLPADIEMACLVAIADAYLARGRDPRLRSESADGIGAASWLDPRPEHLGMPHQAAELLAPWRRIAL